MRNIERQMPSDLLLQIGRLSALPASWWSKQDRSRDFLLLGALNTVCQLVEQGLCGESCQMILGHFSLWDVGLWRECSVYSVDWWKIVCGQIVRSNISEIQLSMYTVIYGKWKGMQTSSLRATTRYIRYCVLLYEYEYIQQSN